MLYLSHGFLPENFSAECEKVPPAVLVREQDRLHLILVAVAVEAVAAAAVGMTKVAAGPGLPDLPGSAAADRAHVADHAAGGGATDAAVTRID